MTLFYISFAILLILGLYFFIFKKASGPPRSLTCPTIKKKFPLIKKDQVSHDSYLFKFGLETPESVLGINVGEHILLHKEVIGSDGESTHISRKYTPTSPVDQKGSFDLLIKIYRKNENPKFPEGGLLTPSLEDLKIGDLIIVSGPKGNFNYLGMGKVLRKDLGSTKSFKNIAMIAGGTGITPMYQVMQSVIFDNQDPTNLVLLFANRSEADILLRSELEEMMKSNKAKIYFSVDQGSPNWKGFTGFIDEEKLLKVLPKPASDVLICICGPPILNKLLRDLLKKLGYNEENIFKF